MADAMEPIWEHMHEDAADELEGRQAHDRSAVPALDPVVFPAECHGIRICADAPVVGDGDAVGVARKVCQHGFGPAEGVKGDVELIRRINSALNGRRPGAWHKPPSRFCGTA